MLDDALKWVNAILDFGTHWPALLSLVIGTLAGFSLTLALEAFFLPNTQDAETQRRQKGYTFLFCWAVSTVASCEFWWAVGTTQKPGVRWTICAIVGVFGFFFYPMLARALTVKFPAIGSAWTGVTKADQ